MRSTVAFIFTFFSVAAVSAQHCATMVFRSVLCDSEAVFVIPERLSVS